MSKSAGKKETLSKKSAAEFFSEHQQIAGFDNPGKSLFTTIREFVENSLDAAESIHALPEIELFVEEFSEAEHNQLNGINSGMNKQPGSDSVDEEFDSVTATKPTKSTSSKSNASKDSGTKEKDQMYYLIRCVDNGCGIPEENIGDMLGRVLSGSKHGIRQTRGKFGLGAKMVTAHLLIVNTMSSKMY
jgi:DNA topoisomerase VI subunit B